MQCRLVLTLRHARPDRESPVPELAEGPAPRFSSFPTLRHSRPSVIPDLIGNLRSLSLPKGRRILYPPAAKNYFSVQLLRKTNFHRLASPRAGFSGPSLPRRPSRHARLRPGISFRPLPQVSTLFQHLRHARTAGRHLLPSPTIVWYSRSAFQAQSAYTEYRVVLTLRISDPKCVHRVPPCCTSI